MHGLQVFLDPNAPSEQQFKLVANPEALGGYPRQSGQVIDDKSAVFQPTMTPSLTGSAVEYLIITTDELAGEYQALADWKTKKGIPAAVVTTSWIADNYPQGCDLQETIRNFIIDAGLAVVVHELEVMLDQVIGNGYHDIAHAPSLGIRLRHEIVIHGIQKVVPVEFIGARITLPVPLAVGTLRPARRDSPRCSRSLPRLRPGSGSLRPE